MMYWCPERERTGNLPVRSMKAVLVEEDAESVLSRMWIAMQLVSEYGSSSSRSELSSWSCWW